MGVIDKATRAAPPEGPKCPFDLFGAMEIYRELKFAAHDNGDSITLHPRGPVTWRDIAAYKEATGRNVSALEVELVMGIDAIFEGKDDG